MVALASAFPATATLAGPYLSLPAGVILCAIPLHRALGVVPLNQITPRCRPEPTYGRTVEIQGRTIPLLTVPALLGLPAQPPPGDEPRACVLFVQVHPSDDATCVGLVLAAPPDPLHFDSGDIGVPDASRRHPSILANARKHDRTFILLDLESVWSAHKRLKD